jgi:2-polyprenyl-3-methyl-5-hydroxy-6-metoxy-1,4-benzoquinol methylase
MKLPGSDYYDEDYFDNPDGKKSNYGVLSGGYTEKVYLPYKKEQAIQILRELGYTSQWKPDNILVVGCAKGFLVRILQQLGVVCEGIDISEYAIEKSKQYTENCKVGNICDMNEYKDNQFEVVICLETIEHIPKPYLDKALNELSRVAKRYIVISTPEGKDEDKTDLSDGGDPSHFSVHTPAFWQAELEKRKFIKDVEYVHGNNYFLIARSF